MDSRPLRSTSDASPIGELVHAPVSAAFVPKGGLRRRDDRDVDGREPGARRARMEYDVRANDGG
jgi:hypothetical protein